MALIQRVERKPHREFYLVYIPFKKLEEAGLTKGDDCEIESPRKGVLEIKKK